MIFYEWEKSLIALNKSNNWITDIGYLFLFLIIFYTLFLGSYPLFTPDEGRYAEIAREMVTSHDYITPRVNGMIFLDKPILYYWLQVIAIHLFGVKEWALRLMPVMAGIMTCLATYIAGRNLFNRHTAILSSFILATTPLYFGSTHYANLDLEVAGFLSSSLLFFICGLQQQTLRHRRYFLLTAYTCSALAVLTKGLIGLILPAMIITIWLMYSKRLFELKKIYLGAGLIIFLSIVLPWYILAQQYNPSFFHYFFVIQHFSRFLSSGTFNNPAPSWFYLPVIGIGFLPWTIFLVPTLYHACKKQPAQLFLLLYISVILVFFSIPHSKIVGYILPIYPPLALLTGHYLSSHFHTLSRQHLLGYAFLFALFSLSLLLFAKSFILISFPDFIFHFNIIISIFFISLSFSFYMVKKNKVGGFIFILIATNICFLLTLTNGATYLNTNTTKPLVFKLKKIKRPSDEVVSYFKYYYDVPLYLGEKIHVVSNWHADDILKQDNWRRELWHGQQFQQPTNTHLLWDENTFWAHYHYSPKRIFVFLNNNYFEQFKAKALYYFYLGKNNDTILLSNQPILENE